MTFQLPLNSSHKAASPFIMKGSWLLRKMKIHCLEIPEEKYLCRTISFRNLAFCLLVFLCLHSFWYFLSYPEEGFHRDWEWINVPKAAILEKTNCYLSERTIRIPIQKFWVMEKKTALKVRGTKLFVGRFKSEHSLMQFPALCCPEDSTRDTWRQSALCLRIGGVFQTLEASLWSKTKW